MSGSFDDERMTEAIHKRATAAERPGGEAYRLIALPEVESIAAQLGVERRLVEQRALADNVIPERYSRNLESITAAEQSRLLEATVTIVGVGGLGGWLAELLARAGVGTLRLIDGDRFDGSNLNRQIFSDESALGREKVDAARERLQQVNGSVTVQTVPQKLTAKNGAELLAGSDAAADCLDSISTRFVLQDVANSAGVPLVSAAVAGLNGQLLTIHPGETGLRAVYGEPDRAPEHGIEVQMGNPPFTVSLLSSLQCAEIVRVLLGWDVLYRNRLLVVDLSNGTFEQVRLA